MTVGEKQTDNIFVALHFRTAEQSMQMILSVFSFPLEEANNGQEPMKGTHVHVDPLYSLSGDLLFVCIIRSMI